jgi:hypothetical protein
VYLVLVVAVNWSPTGRVCTWYLRLLCIRVIHVVCVLGTCGCCELVSHMSRVYLVLAVAVNWCRTGRVCTWYLWLL